MANNRIKPEILFKQIITIASKYVESHDALMKELIDRNKGVYALRNTAHPIIMDGVPQFYLMQVKNCNGLFIHICVTLKSPYSDAALDKNHEFEGVSIHFLQGTKTRFCRAEWDVKKRKDKLEHPQPHWHWGYAEVNNSDRFETTETAVAPFLREEGEEGFSLSTLPSIDFEELHYAMATKWITQDTAVEDFTFQHLYDWMKRCIGSVIDQYNYQVNKGSFVTSRWW